MNAAALLRAKIQATLAPHLRTELEFRPYALPDVVPSGIPELDALVGGLPRGALTEVCGPASSGRTSLVHSVLAQMTQKQEVCAVVDASDSLDPESLAGAGVELTRILWVRCGEARRTEKIDVSVLPPEVEKSKSASPPKGKHYHDRSGSRQPRDSARGLDKAMEFLRDKNREVVVPKNNWHVPLPAKPGVSGNLYVASCSGEQVSIDRQVPRRADYFFNQRKDLHLKEDAVQDVALNNAENQSATFAAKRYEKPWTRLEQAVKAVDLLLHGGGFGSVVLDLGNITWADARRISLTTWFRFRRAVENTPTVLLVLAEDSCAKTCASLVLSCRRSGEEWTYANSSAPVRNRATLAGLAMQVEVLRSRVQPGFELQNRDAQDTDLQSADLQNGKPVRSVHSSAEFAVTRSMQWHTSTLWTG